MIRREAISVALCTYNGASFVQAQLESILNQTYPPDEIIICDDASSDATVSILKSLVERNPSVIHLYQNKQKLGLHKNFSQAIEQTTGDIIFLADQDDVWLPERIATMLRYFSADANVGLVYSNAAIVNTYLQPTGRLFFDFVSLPRISNPKTCDVVRFSGGIPGCLMAIQARLKPMITPINPEWNYDYYIAFTAYALSTVVKINQPLMYYRRHGNNSSSDDIFEGDWLTGFNAARKASTLDYYSSDRLQWEIMLTHLNEIANTQDIRSSKQLDEYLTECCLRVEFAKSREDFTQRTLFYRLSPALDGLFRKKYHRYLRGMKSFGKDLFLGQNRVSPQSS